MTISILAFDALNPVKQQCLNDTFRKRKFYAPTLNMSPYPPPTTQGASCQEKLAEANAVYHQLMMGQSVVSLNHDGRSITYGAADRGSLWTYIKSLEAQCGDSATHSAGCSCGSCNRSVGRARSVSFY